jgi:hypothetical protein
VGVGVGVGVDMGDDVIWLLNPDAVREGICRMARLPGDCIKGDLIDGEDMTGGGGGVPLVGESCGDRRELMSIATGCVWPKVTFFFFLFFFFLFFFFLFFFFFFFFFFLPHDQDSAAESLNQHAHTKLSYVPTRSVLYSCACTATGANAVVGRK